MARFRFSVLHFTHVRSLLRDDLTCLSISIEFLASRWSGQGTGGIGDLGEARRDEKLRPRRASKSRKPRETRYRTFRLTLRDTGGSFNPTIMISPGLSLSFSMARWSLRNCDMGKARGTNARTHCLTIVSHRGFYFNNR